MPSAGPWSWSACLDEIFFHGRPVLVGVEPASMAWFVGQKAGSPDGLGLGRRPCRPGTLCSTSSPTPGRPLQAGIAREPGATASEHQDPLASTLDVFHTKHEARKALTIDWNQVERDCEAFDQAEARLRKDQRQGIDARAAASGRGGLGTRLVQSFDRYEAIEAAWKHAEAALAVFRPDGRLNDRAWAEARVAPALPALVGRAWVTVRQPPCEPRRASRSWTGCTRVGVAPDRPGAA